MFGIPVAISGAVTIALIVVLGIFVYPLLLRRPGGRVLVTLATAFLVGLFTTFQAATDGASGLSIVGLRHVRLGGPAPVGGAANVEG